VVVFGQARIRALEMGEDELPFAVGILHTLVASTAQRAKPGAYRFEVPSGFEDMELSE
jgi:hypothetical protein